MKKYLVCQEDSDHRIWSALPIIVRVMYRVGCLLAARELGDGAGCGGAGLEGGALHSAPLPRLVVRRGLIAEASQRLAADGAFAAVSYTHLRAHETRHDLVCRLL